MTNNLVLDCVEDAKAAADMAVKVLQNSNYALAYDGVSEALAGLILHMVQQGEIIPPGGSS